MSDQASFSQFGKKFQETFVHALLTDHRFAEQMQEVFQVEYVELKYLQFLTQRFFDYSRKYKLFPSLSMLVTIIRDELKEGLGSDHSLRDQIVDYLVRMQKNTELGDLPFVKDKSLEFCRKQALRRALENAVDKMTANKYESIVEEIKKAVMVGTAPQLGHDFFTDYEARFTTLSRNAIPSCLPQLNHKTIFDGGYGAGELAVIMAPSGVGKSHFLVAEGCNALSLGKNVVHYTFELSETRTGVRYDSNICRIDSNDVIENKSTILAKYEEMNADLGRLIIKYDQPNTATVYTLRAHLERLSLKGFKPDMIIIDYADLMRSTRQYDSLRHELKLIYEELRALAGELGIPILTASQSNKEGSSQDVIDITNMSESYGKAMTADIVLSISRKVHEKSTGVGRIYIAKNRAGRDGILFPIMIDTAQSRFEIRGEEMSPDDHKEDAQKSLRDRIKSSWSEAQKEFRTTGIDSASS